jgi:hypothetical protein
MSVTGKYGEWAGSCTACPHGETSELGATRCRALTSTDKSLSVQVQRRKWPADPRVHSPALDAKSAQIQPRHWNPDPYAQVHKPAWTTMKWHPKSQQLWHTEPDGH